MNSTVRPVLLAAALLLGQFAEPALAANWDVRIAGVGARPCSDWLDWKNTQKGELRAMALEWTQGFITAHNVYARANNASVNSVIADAKVLLTLLDAYCQKTPESRILNGVLEVTRSLGGASVNIVPKSPATRERPAESRDKGPI